MAASSFSPAFIGMGDENEIQIKEQQQQILSAVQSQPSASNLLKKRRNQPGNPYPDAEIVALSPKTLMATNRFICEVCNKGFQREQNLQLHRRGHNLPWKLKQKGPRDQIKRKVYLCPEPSCVHHEPGRALGDLTGIKKHYSRKHGEKKYKCDKCSKKYAVQSDWKAHIKTCGTREYKCDCGTLFSRRDSFITHRAFCDALAQESARNLNPSSLTSVGFNPPLATQDVLRLGTRPGSQFDTLIGPGFSLQPPSSAAAALFGMQPHNDQQQEENNHSMSPFGLMLPNKSSASFQGLMQLPPQLQIAAANNGSSSSSMAGLFNLGFFTNGANTVDNAAGARQGSGGGPEEYATLFSSGNIMNAAIPSLYSTSHAMQNPSAAHMSATALLQKAAQLGSTTSNNAATSLLKTFGKSSQPTLDPENYGGSSSVFGENYNGISSHLQDLVNPMNNSVGGGSYDEELHDDEYRGFRAYNGNNTNSENDTGFSSSSIERAGAGRLTRDFLGVGRGQLQHGLGFSSLMESQGKNGASSQAFGRGSFH